MISGCLTKKKDELVDDAIKQLCKDVIVVATHEVTVEDDLETRPEDKEGTLKTRASLKLTNYIIL